MNTLDLDIQNYEIPDLERFFRLDTSIMYDAADVELKENENVSVMLYSLRRTAELISLNKQNKTLTFESKLEFAGEINDNIVILKNNKICLFGKITKIY